MMTEECEKHHFVHGGVKYSLSSYPIPGGGAFLREYFDWYYCTSCLEMRFKKLTHEDSSYEVPKFGATPINEHKY